MPAIKNKMETHKVIAAWFGGIVAIVLLFVLIIWGWQTFRVYSAGQAGKAELAQAEYNRQIKVREAQALKDAALLQAEAEIERAKGIAEANRIIAGSLQGNESYLRYLWIDKLSDNPNVIYVPTEAGLPILEASRKGTLSPNN